MKLKENGGLPAHILWTLAIVAGVSVANIYYNQPLLNLIRQELGITEFSANLIAMITQVGYALGLLFIIPLGDLYPRKKIILANFTLLICSMLIEMVGLGWGPAWVVIIIIMRELAVTVGIVISGLLTGILASRVVSGYIGELLGWREMYYIAAGMMVVCAVVVLKVLPDIRPTFSGRYSDLMKSLFQLVRDYPELRIYSIRSALAFGSMLGMWSCLAFKMGSAPFYADSDVIGFLGLCGVAGALTASFVGSWVKKVGVRNFNYIGCGLILLSWCCFYFGQNSFAAIVAGILLIDIGMQCIQLSNQTSIFHLCPSASNRLNTIFMTTYFIGGSLGTFLAGSCWELWGWGGVSAVASLLTLISLGITVVTQK